MGKKIRLVIDTNLWVSYFLGEGTRTKLKLILYDERFKLLVSRDLLGEIRTVLTRPKFKKYINPNQIEEILTTIQIRADLIEVVSKIELSRDAKDNFILALCQDGQVDELITGDDDLLSLNPFQTTQIRKITDFFNAYFE